MYAPAGEVLRLRAGACIPRAMDYVDGEVKMGSRILEHYRRRRRRWVFRGLPPRMPFVVEMRRLEFELEKRPRRQKSDLLPYRRCPPRSRRRRLPIIGSFRPALMTIFYGIASVIDSDGLQLGLRVSGSKFQEEGKRPTP